MHTFKISRNTLCLSQRWICSKFYFSLKKKKQHARFPPARLGLTHVPGPVGAGLLTDGRLARTVHGEAVGGLRCNVSVRGEQRKGKRGGGAPAAAGTERLGRATEPGPAPPTPPPPSRRAAVYCPDCTGRRYRPRPRANFRVRQRDHPEENSRQNTCAVPHGTGTTVA